MRGVEACSLGPRLAIKLFGPPHTCASRLGGGEAAQHDAVAGVALNCVDRLQPVVPHAPLDVKLVVLVAVGLSTANRWWWWWVGRWGKVSARNSRVKLGAGAW